LRRAVTLDLAAVDCIEAAFRALAGGGVVMPPILSMAIPEHNGEVDVKTAYVPGVEGFAIKVSPGFFDNPKLGLPSTSGLMVLLSSRTGQVAAVLLDNGYLTDVRTAAAGAVAARHLAREDAASACIMGAGLQARMQLRALCLVRPIRRAGVWARNAAQGPGHGRRDDAANWALPVTAETDPAAAVAAADVIVTTTPATAPDRRGRLAAARPARHRHGLGPARQERTGAGLHRARRSLRPRPPVADPRRWGRA
jgi:ornithine cyclodeaminase